MLKKKKAGSINSTNPLGGLDQSNEYSTQVDYSSEEERIKSFVTWPVHFPVDPIRLAKAGFYFTGSEDEVICFSCHGKIKNWNYGDVVQKKHYNLYPDCDFVNGRSKNIPTFQSKFQKEFDRDTNLLDKKYEGLTYLSEIIKNINYKQMTSMYERLKTFQNKWPHSNINTMNLAQAGFFYLGYEDKVQCPFCKGIVSNWEIDDDPFKEHEKHFAWCDYLSNEEKKESIKKTDLLSSDHEDLCGNMQKSMSDQASINSKLLDQDQEHQNLEKLGIHFYSSPAHPQQASLSARLRSFASWPSLSPVSKEDLAKAGFFYIGIGDHTKCFHCNGGLCNWEEGDDPWVEHVKWFCNCHFLRLNRGKEFIESCLNKNTPEDFKENSPKHVSSYFSSENLLSKVDEAMKSEMVQYCLDSGLFPHYIVRVAVLRHIEKTGSNFSDVNELCSYVSCLKDEMEKSVFKRENSYELSHNEINIRNCVVTPSQSERNQFVSDNQDQTQKRDETTSEVLPSNSIQSDLAIKKDEVISTTLDDQRLCKICMDKEVGAVFLPCGHLLACTECAAAMTLCPICRKTIKATVRAYLP